MQKKYIIFNIPSVLLICEGILFITWNDVFFDKLMANSLSRIIIALVIPLLAIVCNVYLARTEKNATIFMCYTFMSLMAILIFPIFVVFYIMSLGSF